MIGQFFRNAGLLAVTEIILKLKGLILIPLLTRYFGPLNYGVWAQVGVLVATFSPLLILGTDSAILRYLPGRPLEEQKRFFSAWLLFLVGITMPVCFFFFVWKREIALMFFGRPQNFESFIPLAAVTLLINLVFNGFKNWYRIQNNAKVFSAISVGQSLLGLLAIAVVLMGKKEVYHLVVYSIILDFLISIWLLLQISWTYGWSIPKFSIIPSLVKYGFPLVPAAYAMWGLNFMDRLFLVKYTSLAEVGVYGVAYSLGYMTIQVFVNPVWLMFSNSAAELHNRNNLAELQKLFDRSLKIIYLFTIPAIAGLFVLGTPLIRFLTTDEFKSGASLIAIISLGYLLHMLASYYDVALGLVYRQYWSTVSIFLAAGVNLVLNILLIPTFSIFGAAVATLSGFFFQFLLSFILANRFSKLFTTNFIFPAQIALVSVLMSLGVYVLMLYLPNSLFILSAFGVILYSLFLVIFRIITFDQVRLLYGALRRGS